MTAAPAITILHLSDLHFGRKHRFERDGFGSLLSRVTLDLKERAATDGLVPDLVVVSGDFAEFGKRDELDHASIFLRELKAYLGLPARRFAMVPGNHDVNWNKSRAYFEDRAGDGLPVEEPYFRKFEHYKRFFDRFYEGEEGITFTEAEPWSLFEMPDLGVVVAGMNSAFAESHQDADHHAFLGERQIRAIAGRMKAFKERGHLRIGVMHHDPFDKRGGAKADQDQKDFRRWLLPSLNLVLHGDIHEETCRHLERDVPAIGVGSAAVGVEERGPDVSNEYQLLVVRSNGVERHLRAWVSDQKRWVVSPRADAAGESGKTFIKADFDAVTALGERTAPAPKVDLAAIVERYRASLVRRQGSPTVFDLLGVGESEESGGLDFLRLFVPQTAVRDVERGGQRGPLHRLQGPVAIDEEMRQPSRDERDSLDAGSQDQAPTLDDWLWKESPRTVDTLFDRPRLLFIGAPGAGKSALTRWLLLKLSVPGERVVGIADGMVPVRVELRSFDQEHTRAGLGYTLFDHVAREQADFHGPLAAEHLRALAEQGRLVWLFDGLDEIADPRRRGEMAGRIAGLLEQHPQCRAVVTGRVAGVDVARPTLEGAMFQTYVLQDFAPEQRDSFLDIWHDLAFRRDPATGANRRARMRAAIGDTPSLQELCKSPLLCSMLAYLHREESLPRRRHLLYQKVLERMAEHWDANKGLPPRPEAESFGLEDKLAFLRSLAWRMQSDDETSGNVIRRSVLEDFAAGFCEARWGQSPDAARRRAEALIHQLHARNGVLTFVGGDAFGFAHRAFLEFLAASEAVERFRTRSWSEVDLRGVFAARWREARWEETLSLTCALLQEAPEGDALVVRAIQSVGAGTPSVIYSRLDEYLHFAIRSLAELRQLKQGISGDFARTINDILLTGAKRPPTHWSVRTDLLLVGWDADILRLGGALRRAAGRWPDVEAMRRKAHSTPYARSPPELFAWFRMWLGAASVEARISEIEEERSAFDFDLMPFDLDVALEVAGGLAPWSLEEIRTLCESIERDPALGRAGKVMAYAALLRTPDLTPKALTLPAAQLFQLMCNADDSLSMLGADVLLDRDLHSDAALQFLREKQRAGNVDQKSHAVRILAVRGRIEEALPTLEQEDAWTSQTLAALLSHAAQGGEAMAAAKRLRARLQHEDDLTFLRFLLNTGDSSLGLFSADEIWARLPKTAAGKSWLLKLPSWYCPRLLASLCSSPHMPTDWLEETVSRLPPWAELWADSKIAEACGRLLAGDDPVRVLADAEMMLQKSKDVSLRSQARARLRALTHLVRTEEDRFHLASSLGPEDPVGRQLFSSLAASASSTAIRIRAAALVGDLSTLGEIAGRAPEEQYRHHARHALDLYGEINALLQVGRLRRARVRFEGRDAGVLEELTKVGNGTQFRYDDSYDGAPIAPNMPLGEPYKDEHGLLPFFENLLPEGALYEQTARKLGLKRSDKLGVLLRVGADTMGAVEILPMESA